MEVCDICRGDVSRRHTLDIPIIQTISPDYSTDVRHLVLCEKCREAIAVAIKKAIGMPYWESLEAWNEKQREDNRPLDEKLSDLFTDKRV